MNMSKPAAPRVEIRALRKAFPGVVALDNVDLKFFPGEVHALLGENGAGKSTVIKVLTGALRRDGGEVLLDGAPVEFRNAGEAQASGVSTVYQEVNLIPAMSVTKNLVMEHEPTNYGMISWRQARAKARERLARLKLDIDTEQPVGMYSVAVQQLVAIARALDENTKALILDEPTASLDADETATLFEIIRDLKSKGIAVVFITHFLDQVYEISDRISVLRNGRMVGSAPVAEMPRDRLVELMIGRELREVERAFASKNSGAPGPVRLEAEALGRNLTLTPTDISVRAGEVVGLAGLLGSGRTELIKLIFGALRADSGGVKLNGRPLGGGSPLQSLQRDVALCPEDRKAEGLVGELSIRENIILSMQSKQGWLKLTPQSEQIRIADEMIKALAIATPDAEKPVNQLSGGNQQKVVLARALASVPAALLLDEPTRGIDVGAHAEIISLIRKLCEEGMALLVASSELDEIVAVADRVAVLRDRRKIGELVGGDIERENIIQLIAGKDGEQH